MTRHEFYEEDFNDIYIPYFEGDDAQKRVQIFFGGASSGKSYFIAQRILRDVLDGRNTLVLRNVARTIRGSCWNELLKAITGHGAQPYLNISKSEMLITSYRGSQILFAGLDDVEKIKSITPAKGVLTDIWIEEATETSYDDYKQLEKRLRGESRHPKRVTMSFNPVYKEHWIYREFFGNWQDGASEYHDDGLSILKTTYKDNRFLTDDDRLALENEQDEYYREVYSLGNWGVLGDVIFRNWRTEDLSDMKRTVDKPLFGLDFGFSSDPAAAVKVSYDKARKRIYILDELYERGLTNTALAPILRDFAGNHYITCDSAEPKSIHELQGLGIKALAAKKGPDSVIHGIQWLQGHEIIVDVKCQHTKNEFQLYQWRKDKDGNTMRVPEDRNNHIIDALRYCMEHEATARYASSMSLRGL
jgi:phage terminase large subunit